jgi:hypothetical protein
MSEQTNMNDSSQRKKVYMVCLIIASMFITTFFSYLVYFQVYGSIIEQLRYDLSLKARHASSLIDGDKHWRVEESKNQKSSLYMQIKQQLQEVRDSDKRIRDVYTMAKTNDPKKVIFVVDAEPEGTDLFSNLGDEYDVEPGDATTQGFLTTSTDEDIYTDEYGTWISGFAPIYDSTGRAIASVGLDISASTVKSEVLKSFMSPFIILLLIEISLLMFLIKQVRVMQI